MATETHRVRNGPIATDHVVQFFDDSDTLGIAVAQFLHDGLIAGANAVVVARPSSMHAIASALTERGLSLPSLFESGRLTILDAAATMQSFMVDNLPDAARFRSVIGTLFRQRRQGGNGELRVYGEMVDLLTPEGNFLGAEALEELWNTLAETESFNLLCGYRAAHFAGPNGTDALRSICATHARVHQDNSDLLATWLLSKAQAT